MAMTLAQRYGTPGVYVEYRTAVRERRISTAVPAFLGLAQEGNYDTPLRLRRWNDFADSFGVPLDGGYLAYAVRGFFANGGEECYVLRLQDNSLPALREALTVVESLEEIDLVCTPDAVTNQTRLVELQRAVIDHCNKVPGRFAILDSDSEANTKRDGVTTQREELQAQRSNAALYYPWIKVPKDLASPVEHVLVPPCGDVAGVYARTDRLAGVHRAPANEVLENAVDVAIDLTDAEQKALNPESAASINCLRAFPGRGIRVWGSRTLSTDPQWVHINVRRLLLTMGRWIESNMYGVVYEPNGPLLWSRIRREVGGYLNDLFSKGAFKGQTPDEAYYVKCDEEINTRDTRDLGWVMTEIGIAPTVPNEFIVIRLIHADSGVSIMPVEKPQTASLTTVALTSLHKFKTSDVRVTFVDYSGPGHDVEREYVKIQNFSSSEVDMGNWTLRDVANHVFRFPHYILKPYRSVRVWTGRGENTETDLYWGSGMAIWNNAGDVAQLYDRRDRQVDAYVYAGVGNV